MWVAGPAASADPRRLGRRRRQDRAARRRSAPRAALPVRRVDGSSPPFELDNRNKRSVALNLAAPRARESPPRLVDEADVFVTNARPGALATGRPRLRDGVGAQPPARVRPRHRLRPRGRRPRSRRVRRRRVLVARRRRRRAHARRRRPARTSAAGWATTWRASPRPARSSAALFARERTGDGPARVDLAAAHRACTCSAGTSAWPCALGMPTTPMSVDGPTQPADHRVPGGRRPAVLDARPPGRPPLARRAAGGRPSRVGRRRAVLVDGRPLAELGRTRRRAQRHLRAPEAARRVGDRSSTARTCGGRRCSTPTRPSTTRRPAPPAGFVDRADATGTTPSRWSPRRSTSPARRGRRARCHPSSRSTPRRCSSNSATTGTGSSNSRNSDAIP